MVIHCTTFDVCTPSSFEGVKEHVCTNIYIFVTHMGCDDVMTSSTYLGNRSGVVINCAKFGVSGPSSF